MPFDEPQLRAMFPVPLITVHLRNAEDLNHRLLKEISERRDSEPGVDRSNRFGWHSDYDLFRRTEPALLELVGEIEAMVVAATAKAVPDAPKNMTIRHEGWINVTPKHGMNAPHDHPGAFWSGTYYVHVPQPLDESDALSGAIEFLDPRGSIGNVRPEAAFTRPKFTIRPAAGTALLWPGFVRHWVHPNRSEEERVSVAFNSWFVPA